MNAFFALRALLFAGEVLVGSLPIMALAFFGAVQRRASARHLTFAGAFAALVLLPVLALVVPSPIRILLPAGSQQIPAATLRDAAAATALPAPATAGIPLDPVTLALALAALWLAGAIVMAVRLGAGAWCLSQLRRRSRILALTPDDMPRVAATHRECELRLARDDTGPITWGIFHPVILLPKTATFWPRERLHAVLLHELAHIRRRDGLVQVLSLVVCAFYWPNPLVWMGARALRREAEIAADDSVIVAGMRPSSYASELLRLAEEFRAGRPTLATLSLYIAERSTLGARVEAVLAPTSLRSGVTVLDVTKAACFALVSAAVIAFACPSLAQGSPPPPAAPSVTPPAPSVPPVRPVVDVAVPDAPAAPPASPAPPSPPVHVEPHIAMHALHAALRAERMALHRLQEVDWKRVHADAAGSRRETGEAVERVRSEIERARREAHEAMERARPEIERAMAQVKANQEAMRAVEKARPEIEAAMRSVGPEVERALAKAREDLKDAQFDVKTRENVDEAMKNAQIKMEMRADDAAVDADSAPDDN